MKTQILRLETSDTATSICDKLAWAKSARILLAFPRRRPPLLDRLDMTLIQRGAARVGSQLAISTLDPTIINVAKIVGIPVFSSMPAAQRLSWSSRAHRGWRPFQRKDSASLSERQKLRVSPVPLILPVWLRVGTFTLALAAFVALVALFLPSATIDLPLTSQIQSMDLTVYPGLGIPGVLPGGQIPAALIKTTIEGQMETEATGEISVPGQFAQAAVTLTNQTGQAVAVPAGTVLLAPGAVPHRFLTLNSGEIAPGRGQQTEVQVRAENPGSSANVPAGAINAIEGLIGLQVTVANAAPAQGGSDRQGRAASEQDYAQLYDQLLTSLTNTALNQLTTGNPHLLVIPESLTVAEILEENRQPPVGLPSDRIKLSLKVAYNGMAVSRADLTAVAVAALDADLPEGHSPNPVGLTLTQKTAWVVLPGQRLTLDVSAARSITPDLNTAALFSQIRGFNPVRAAEIIQFQLNLDEPPRISINPAWWPRLPVLPFRIQAESS